MRVIVCGSRSWTDRDRIADRLCDLVLSLPRGTQVTIVHGNAAGADRTAHQEAQKHGLFVEPHPADWSIGKRAGPMRNQKMADLGADLCIAFLKDQSTGTQDMIERARKAGIPVDVIHG